MGKVKFTKGGKTMNYEEKIQALEDQISFLLQEYNILANKMNHYTAAFKIIENSMPDLKANNNMIVVTNKANIPNEINIIRILFLLELFISRKNWAFQ